MRPNSNHLISTIKEVLKRPGMYSVNRVEDISLILLGFQFAAEANNQEKLSNFRSEFRALVRKHFDCKEDYDGFRLIRLHSGSDKHSLELFENIFNEYLKTK